MRARIREALWNEGEGRARAGVRLALHFGALGLGLGVLAMVSGWLPSIVAGPVAFSMVVLFTWAAARGLDHRRFVDLGLRIDAARALDALAGAAVGGLSIGLVMALERASGAATFAPVAVDVPRAANAAFVAVFFVGVAVQEELVFRGYHLLNLTEGLASARLSGERAAWLATLLASVGFGLAHAGNDGASIVATLQVALAGGTLLAVGFVLTGDLAFSIGLHFAWNFAQAALGMPVSGFVLDQAALMTRTTHGPDLFTGGAFGPEASLFGLTAMAFGTTLSLAYVRARYGALRPSLRRFTPPSPPSPASSAPPSGDR